MPRYTPDHVSGIMKARLFAPSTTPAQALWESRDRWNTVVLVAGRCEVYFRSRSISLPSVAFDHLVSLFVAGYPCDRKVMRCVTRDRATRDKLHWVGFDIRVRDRFITRSRTHNGGNYAQPKPYPRPTATWKTLNTRREAFGDRVI